MVGLGRQWGGAWETAEETRFCSQAGRFLGELDSGDCATSGFFKGWPGALGSCLFTFSHALYYLHDLGGQPASALMFLAVEVRTGLHMLAQSAPLHPSWCHLLTYSYRVAPLASPLCSPAGAAAFSTTSVPPAFASDDPMTWLGTSHTRSHTSRAPQPPHFHSC